MEETVGEEAEEDFEDLHEAFKTPASPDVMLSPTLLSSMLYECSSVFA